MDKVNGFSFDIYGREMHDVAPVVDAVNANSRNPTITTTYTTSVAHIADQQSLFEQSEPPQVTERVVSPTNCKIKHTSLESYVSKTTVTIRPYEDHFLDPISSRGRRMFDYRPDLSSGAIEMTRRVPFPLLLYWILEEASEKGYDHIISWMPHGRGFAIFDRQEMARVIMPK